jgi:hypothetical protein
LNYKRYFVYAKRKGEKWSDWSQSNRLEDAIKQSDAIKQFGWFSRIWDRERKEVLENNG